MSRVFAEVYSDAYDGLYSDKDYVAECNLIEEVFRRFTDTSVDSVLDLGCGTGSHAVLLAERGYRLTGVERSAQMLRHARAKADRAELDITWLEGDIRTVDAGGPFDAVLLMFAVLSYQTENADVLATLRTIRRHLAPGGLAVFDAWYGPGVLTHVPNDTPKVATTPSGAITRTASSQLDTRRHLCHVRYELRADDKPPDEPTVETHVVRYFFPMELELFLDLAGLQLLVLCPFGRLDDDADERTRNALVVAQPR